MYVVAGTLADDYPGEHPSERPLLLVPKSLPPEPVLKVLQDLRPHRGVEEPFDVDVPMVLEWYNNAWLQNVKENAVTTKGPPRP